MARSSRTNQLEVYFNECPVGVFERNRFNAVSFNYSKEWLGDEENAFPLSISLPLDENTYSGDVAFNFLENLVPENELTRVRLAHNVGSPTTDSFNLLQKIGRDCVGAFQFLPKSESELLVQKSGKAPVSDSQIAEIIRNFAHTPLGVNTKENSEFRISIAGTQNKTAFLWDKGWYIPFGLTPTSHIFKPKIESQRSKLDFSLSVQNEHFCLTLCRELGLSAAKSEIMEFDGESVLVVERFDRRVVNGQICRIPQEDFCQALAIAPDFKYDQTKGANILNCLNLLQGSIAPVSERLTFLKALIVFWMIGATDGHTKNFSIFHLTKNQYTLTPLYDVLSLLPNVALGNLERKDLKMAMFVGKNREFELDKITISHFLETAKEGRVSVKRLTTIIEELDTIAESAFERAVSTMPDNFPAQIYEPIGENILNRAFI